MGTHKSRTVAVLAASSALAIASVAPSVAQEATPTGVGSSSGSLSVLTLALGTDALGLRLLGEDSQTSNDPAAGGPSALERVSPLQVASALVPALAEVSQPTVETRSTSGEQATSTPAVDLGALVAGAPVPGLLTGTIDPVGLRSAVDANGAVSTATATVRNLAVFGGLLSAGTAQADLGSSALVSDAGSVRGVQLDSLEVFDLSALLEVLGISLADLPIDVAIGLLDALGLPLPGGVSREALVATIDGLLAQTSAVRAQVATLQGQIDALQLELATLTSELSEATASVALLTSQLATAQTLLAACVVLCEPIQAQVTSLSAQLATATASVASIDAAIDALQAQIEALLDQIEALLATVRGALDQLLGLLDDVLAGLDGASLLAVEDLVVGVTARADDTLDTSVASVVASVGAVRIGGLSLGGLDVGSTTAQLTALADQVTSTLGGILATIDPSLGDLVDVHLLEQATSVSENAGVTEASAAITGLRASITPPDVCGVLSRLAVVPDTLGSVLGGLGGVLPSLPGPVTEVLGDLGSTVTCTAATSTVTASGLVGGVATALTQPLTVSALSVAGAGAFATPFAPVTPGTPTTPGQLPATGGNERLALLALGLGVIGFATRRLLIRCS